MSFQDLLVLHAALKNPEVKAQFAALEQVRREWEADKAKVQEERRAIRESFLAETREGLLLAFRLVKDASLFVVLWSVLWAIERITHLMPVPGRLAEWAHTVHELTVVAGYCILGLAMLWDALDTRLLKRLRKAGR